jgi:hypothetical protein
MSPARFFSPIDRHDFNETITKEKLSFLTKKGYPI